MASFHFDISIADRNIFVVAFFILHSSKFFFKTPEYVLLFQNYPRILRYPPFYNAAVVVNYKELLITAIDLVIPISFFTRLKALDFL